MESDGPPAAGVRTGIFGKVDRTPLAELASRLQIEVGSDEPSPRGIVRCDGLPETPVWDTPMIGIVAEAASHVERAPDIIQPVQPCSAGGAFSLANWQARLSERYALQAKKRNVATACTDRAVVTHPLDPSASLPGDAAAGQGRGRSVTESDLEFLSTFFRSRDAHRMRRTVLPIASLIRAGERDKAKELFTLAHGGLYSLARESWSLLRQRHPEVEPDLGMPSLEQVDPLTHSMRPSRCATYLLPRQTSSSFRSSSASAFSSGSGSRTYRRSRKPGCFESDVDFDSQGGETGSTMDCSPRETLRSLSPSSMTSRSRGLPGGSLTSSPSESSAPCSGNLMKVVAIDDEAAELENSVRNRALYGHRDDWELQYILSFALDEAFHRLEHGSNDAFGETAATEAAVLLERCRERVLEWTVKRWHTSLPRQKHHC